MKFTDEFKEKVISANKLEDVVGEVADLKRSGRDYVCLCPFHNERTPSFSISTDKQLYHCFGCGVGGDVINFVMEYQNLDFQEAVQYLAQRAGISLPKEETKEDKWKSRLYKMNKEAMEYYQLCLAAPCGERCRSYLGRDRRLSDSVLEQFSIGYAPKVRTALTAHMKRLGHTDEELLKSKLAFRANNGIVCDTFRDRVMFPFVNEKNKVVGFTGRTLCGNSRKYVNSAGTEVFDKSRFVYALNLAKRKMPIFLCEGNVDVITLYQAGITNAVATCGTAFTAEQAAKIKLYSDTVYICYDNDEAGQKATAKALTILQNMNVNAQVIRVQGVKDVDEYIKAYGAESFKNNLMPLSAADYRLETAKAMFDLDSEKGKLDYEKKAVEIISNLRSAYEIDRCVHNVAEELGTEAVYILKDVKQKQRQQNRKQFYGSLSPPKQEPKAKTEINLPKDGVITWS